MNLSWLTMALLCVAGPVDQELRTWRSGDGEFSVVARLVSWSGERVVLSTEDGKEIDVDFDKLSPRDHLYLKNLEREQLIASGLATQSRIRTFPELFDAREKQEFAVDVLQLYETFVNDPSIDWDSRDKARSQLTEWTIRAEREMFRYGTKWVTASEQQRMQAQGERLRERVKSYYEADDLENLLETLEQIGDVDAGSFDADYFLGMFWALQGKSPVDAERHFENMYRKLRFYETGEHGVMSRNLAVALTNLALVELRLDEAADAVQHLNTALRLAPDLATINHNVSHAYDLSNDNRFFYIPDLTRTRLGELVQLWGADQRDAFPGQRWLYLPLFEPAFGDAAALKNSGESEGSIQVAGTASGFVVSPGILVTNRRVVTGAPSFDVVLNDGRIARGTTLAVHPNLDLALVEFGDQSIPAMRLFSDEAEIGMDVGLLGYPTAGAVNGKFQSTNGSITELNGANRLSFDALAAQGNCGGPLVDKNGQVIGLCSIQLHAELENRYNTAISAAALRQFIAQQVPQFKDPYQLSYPIWSDMVEEVRKSVVQVRILVQPGESSLTAKANGRVIYFEDPWCMVCNGHDRVTCNGRSCNNGKQSVREPYIVQTNQGPVTRFRIKRIDCSICRGDGYLACPNPSCSGGRD